VIYDFQMQSSIREHKDNAGGVFNRYNVIKVSQPINSSCPNILRTGVRQFLERSFLRLKMLGIRHAKQGLDE
jgi:hypothetical protein